MSGRRHREACKDAAPAKVGPKMRDRSSSQTLIRGSMGIENKGCVWRIELRVANCCGWRDFEEQR